MRIRVKFLIHSLAFSLIPLTLVGILSYKIGEESIRDNLGSAFQHSARETADQLDRNLYEFQHSGQTWTGLDLMQDVLAAMGSANLPPELAYAFKKTGLILMAELADEYPPETVEEYNAAIEEYFELKKAGILPKE